MASEQPYYGKVNMFSSILFRRIFLSVFLIVLCYAVSFYYYCVPMINRTIYRLEEESAKTILNHVSNLVKNEHHRIQAYEQTAIQYHKQQIKNILLLVESILNYKFELSRKSELPDWKAREEALAELRHLRYDFNNYVWVADYDSVLISHPDPDLNNADFSAVRDIHGKLIVPPMIRKARENKDGFTTYFWRRLEGETPVEKLAYSRDFPQWGWVIGTGVYLDDVKAEIRRQKQAMIEELREIIHTTRIGRTGYMYIFDSDLNMIIHPNSNIEKTNFSSLENPVTGRSIGKELIAVAGNKDPKLYYKWDKPTDKGKYIYDKFSWVEYFKPLDWYIVSSVYIDELNMASNILRQRILLTSVVMFFLINAIACFFIYQVLKPIKRLSDMAVKAKNGDLSVQSDFSGNDEISILGEAFNIMIRQLRKNIQELDDKVRERTREIMKANELLMQEIEERSEAEKKLQTANTELHTAIDQANRMALMAEISNQKLSQQIKEQQAAKQALTESEERYRTIIENIEDGYYEVDLKGNMLYCNDALCRILGYSRKELIGMNFHQYMDEKNAKDVFKSFNNVYKTGESTRAFDWELLRKDGGKRYIEASVSLITAKGESIGFRGIARDITERKKTEEELVFLAYHDPLTGLYNRKAFYERLEEIIAHAKRYNDEKNIFFVDLDKFKRVNDTCGHEAGDKLLQEVARRLKSTVRETDYVCRFGGDEFAIILNESPETGLERIAERIIQEISRPYFIDRHKIDYITPSIGISNYPKDGENIKMLINRADKAMYKAKEKGNRFIVYADHTP